MATTLKKEKLLELLLGEKKWDIIDALMQESPSVFTHIGVLFNYSWNQQGYTFLTLDGKTITITSVVLIVLLIKNIVKNQASTLVTNEDQMLKALENRGQAVSFENLANIQDEAFNVIAYMTHLKLIVLLC